MKPRHRLAIDQPLQAEGAITLAGNPAHYLSHVLRLTTGDAVALFNRTDGEWQAIITQIHKKSVELRVEGLLRPVETLLGLTVCFAPIKGGRMETIVEKVTELGADILQPVLTRRTVVDRINRDRLTAIAREAAEQCERTSWPEICEPIKLEALLDDWPVTLPLIYGDESGQGIALSSILSPTPPVGEGFSPPTHWAVLAGPEGGFAPEELVMLRRIPAAIGVGLGPRILRADTAIITLCALTLAAWGDWHQAPRFHGDS